jgi:hypothetical protein
LAPSDAVIPSAFSVASALIAATSAEAIVAPVSDAFTV